MRVGTVQMYNRLGNKTHNVGRMMKYVERGVNLNLDLLCFPELAVNGYCVTSPDPDALRKQAEPRDGPAAQEFMKALEGSNLVLAYGILGKGPDKPYNSYVFLGAEGVLHVYRKTHMSLCADHHEADLFARGNDIGVFDLKGTRCGSVICWDGFFPETMRVLALKGAELIVWALAGLGRGYSTETAAPVRAMDNGVYLVVSATAGPFGEHHFEGGTGIFDRNGRAIAKAVKDAEDLAWAEIGPTEAKEHQQERRLTERRPKLYGPIAE